METNGVLLIEIHKNISAAGQVFLTTRDGTAVRVSGGLGDYDLRQTFLDFASAETNKMVAISIINNPGVAGHKAPGGSDQP